MRLTIKPRYSLSAIENYQGVWKEQETCLQRIKDYREGKRYDNLV